MLQAQSGPQQCFGPCLPTLATFLEPVDHVRIKHDRGSALTLFRRQWWAAASGFGEELGIKFTNLAILINIRVRTGQICESLLYWLCAC